MSDGVQLSASHQYRVWGVSANGSYARNGGIEQQRTTSYRSAGLEVTGAINRRVSTYFSYTYLMQGAPNFCLAGTCAFNGDEHIFGFGFTWQPRGWRVGR